MELPFTLPGASIPNNANAVPQAAFSTLLKVIHRSIHTLSTNNKKQTVSRETRPFDLEKQNYTDVIHNVDNYVYAILPAAIRKATQLTW